MFNVYQHWDPLKVCAVGKSYPPEFYNFIKNQKAQSVMKRIAEETEEDYLKLINLLHKFGVETVRPNINPNFEFYHRNGKIVEPPMEPCDFSIMIGETFYHGWQTEENETLRIYNDIRDSAWPDISTLADYYQLPDFIKQEVQAVLDQTPDDFYSNQPIIDLVKAQGNPVIQRLGDRLSLNRAMITRVGRDLYHGTDHYEQDQKELLSERQQLFSNYRNHIVNSGGHSDGTFCPVKPGLIISLQDIPTYKDTFPDWEVVYLPGQSWDAVKPFLDLKEKNQGKFWVAGEEYNDDFTNYVNEWLDNWVGYCEETVFDVNMLVIDQENVIVNNENPIVFEAFERHGITPHICNFRHRYFWDGGLHCITSDLHREGQQQDYFPNRS